MLKLALSLTPLILITSCSVSKSSTAELTIQPLPSPRFQVSLSSPESPNPQTQAKIEQFINQLTTQGYNPTTQGIWIQSGNTLLANYRGTTPLPAASIAKVATTLVALHTFNPDHQFITHSTIFINETLLLPSLIPLNF